MSVSRDSSERCRSWKFWLALRSGYDFGEREQRAQRRSQRVLGLPRRGRPADPHRSHRTAARLDHLLERLPLVLRVALDGFDQIADQIMASLELHLDVGPCRLRAIAQPDEAVVDAGEHEDHHDDDTECDEEHGRPPAGKDRGENGGTMRGARRMARMVARRRAMNVDRPCECARSTRAPALPGRPDPVRHPDDTGRGRSGPAPGDAGPPPVARSARLGARHDAAPRPAGPACGPRRG